MKKKILRWLSAQNWIYKLSVVVISHRIVWGDNFLTPKYLTDRGWIEEDGYFVEPNLKEKNKIRIRFEAHYFRVWYGREKTFIALESKIEWFENYYILAHSENGRYELAGI